MANEIERQKFLRLKSVLEKTGLTRSMTYELIKERSFPTSINLGARAVGWLESEIDDWIAQRVAARRSPSHKTSRSIGVETPGEE